MSNGDRIPPGGGHVYLLHFTKRYKHAGHYMGATNYTVEERLRAHRGLKREDGHRAGRPAKLVKALLADGGDFVLADVWTTETAAEAFDLERRLKRAYKGMGQICSICSPNNKRGNKLRPLRSKRALDSEGVRGEGECTPNIPPEK